MIIVPTDNPGYKIVRETPVLGINGGHYEVKYDNVEVPEENLLGSKRARIHHCTKTTWARKNFSLHALVRSSSKSF
jgi:alkylation response protein AidB-like acyl-CoA dehydrogenase